ncbi:sporulation protein YpjB [Kroppenstedtia sanguinis]|uniref:Sporulation protein YpjB n=1 Tax=Kroppenstedtia sanguinis TaxID=1380684 RepID=A0ABW4C875_9BACL
MRWMVGVLGGILIWLGGSGWAWASGKESVEGWSQQAERVDQLVREGKVGKAQEELSQLASRFSQGDFSEVHLSVEGIGALSDTLVDLDQELVRVMRRPQRLREASERLRLAFDALAHPDQPLWQGYVSKIGNDIGEIQRGIKKDHPETVLSGAEKLKVHFGQIEPALWVSRHPETAGRIQSYVYSLKSQAGKSPVTWVPLQSALEQWEPMIQPSMLREEEGVWAVSGESPDWRLPAFTVSGVLLLALGYVGWRKYRSEQQEVVTLGRR